MVQSSRSSRARAASCIAREGIAAGVKIQMAPAFNQAANIRAQ